MWKTTTKSSRTIHSAEEQTVSGEKNTIFYFAVQWIQKDDTSAKFLVSYHSMHYFTKQKHFSHVLEDFFFNLVLLCGKGYGKK